MPNVLQLPSEYVPYETTELCGNTLRNVKVPFQIGGKQPLLIGRGFERHPTIWLTGYAQSGAWADLVRANIVARPVAPSGQSILVLRDASQPTTIVMIGAQVVVNATSEVDGNTVHIASIDLRPAGLNIFGSDKDGLSFAGNKFSKNRFTDVAVAFASD